LTTSYPSSEQDPSSIFIARLLAAIRKRGYSIKVVAPSDGTFHGRREVYGIETARFGYFFPRSLERLTRAGGGVPENLAKSVLARIQLFPMMSAFLIASLKESRGYDLIYANWLGAGIIGAIVNLFTGKPLVVSFRGDDGYLARERLSWWAATRWVCERASFLAPVSGELLRILVELGAPEQKCRLPRFGVDVEMFHPSDSPSAGRDEVRVIFVGSLIPRKGLHDLLEAMADPRLSNIVLDVVGDGYFGAELKAMSARLGLGSRAAWRGALSQAEVARLMRSSDLLCLPSYMEGRPNVVNEAMASGVPVISTRIGGVPDMIVHGETGLLFDAGNVEELRQCLHILAADPGLRDRMGKNGRELLIRSGVSWDATAEDFDAIFASL
jgi:glycosyltransferase involved in cell wall biosynthesis